MLEGLKGLFTKEKPITIEHVWKFSREFNQHNTNYPNTASHSWLLCMVMAAKKINPELSSTEVLDMFSGNLYNINPKNLFGINSLYSNLTFKTNAFDILEFMSNPEDFTRACNSITETLLDIRLPINLSTLSYGNIHQPKEFFERLKDNLDDKKVGIVFAKQLYFKETGVLDNILLDPIVIANINTKGVLFSNPVQPYPQFISFRQMCRSINDGFTFDAINTPNKQMIINPQTPIMTVENYSYSNS